MGKKKEPRVKLPMPYTERERHNKIMIIMNDIAKINLSNHVPQEAMSAIVKWANTGEEYHAEFDLTSISRIMKIDFVNDKRKDSGIRITFKKVNIEGENPDHPIHEYNRILEEVVPDT